MINQQTKVIHCMRWNVSDIHKMLKRDGYRICVTDYVTTNKVVIIAMEKLKVDQERK